MARTVYRPSPALAGRGIGVGAITLGVAAIAFTLIVSTSVEGAVKAVLMIAAALLGLYGAVVFVVGIVRLAGGGTRLILDDEGFLNATGPRSGVRSARWADVRKVQTDGSVVSIDLAGARQSIVRTRALGIDSRELARDLRQRLRR